MTKVFHDKLSWSNPKIIHYCLYPKRQLFRLPNIFIAYFVSFSNDHTFQLKYMTPEKPNRLIIPVLFVGVLMGALDISIVLGLVQASFVFIPNFAVGQYAVDSSQASFMLIPLVLATAIGAPIFGRLIDKYGSKPIIMQ